MEEVLYDTSVLIDLLRSGKTEAKGFTTILNVLEFPKALNLKGLSVIYPSANDYDEALGISASLLKTGKPVPAIDILIAAICIRKGLTLHTKDTHFKNIELVRKEFKAQLIE